MIISDSMFDEQNMKEVDLVEDRHIVSPNNSSLKRTEEE